MDKGLEKGLLGQVPRLLRIGYHAARQAINLPLVFFYQFFEGREISLLGPGHKLIISHGASLPAFIDIDPTELKMLSLFIILIKTC
jgi:hypothetical protein